MAVFAVSTNTVIAGMGKPEKIYRYRYTGLSLYAKTNFADKLYFKLCMTRTIF
ncbi:protein of unknown function [Candidatus Nitrosotalea okcheonensis]|uniref:Uncharacterized protein n=1 Tax=Candidatus Nitrosotalea okcheonensis TaxID=1903276 RepID=A0A2H1FCA8_9ARCH|nr:protein of unknown function [Candidatus Nitrosotalea okcheonensis]